MRPPLVPVEGVGLVDLEGAVVGPLERGVRGEGEVPLLDVGIVEEVPPVMGKTMGELHSAYQQFQLYT